MWLKHQGGNLTKPWKKSASSKVLSGSTGTQFLASKKPEVFKSSSEMFSLGKTKVATAETTTELAQLMASVAWAQALNDETISDSYEQIFTSLIFASKKPRSQRFIEDSKGTQALTIRRDWRDCKCVSFDHNRGFRHTQKKLQKWDLRVSIHCRWWSLNPAVFPNTAMDNPHVSKGNTIKMVFTLPNFSKKPQVLPPKVIDRWIFQYRGFVSPGASPHGAGPKKE